DRDPQRTQYREAIHGFSRNCWKINDFSLVPPRRRRNQSNPAWVALAAALGTGGRLSRYVATACRSAAVILLVLLAITSPMAEPTTSPLGNRPESRNVTSWLCDQLPMPVALSGVILGIFMRSGPVGLPEKATSLSSPPRKSRGVWHSPQWARPCAR